MSPNILDYTEAESLVTGDFHRKMEDGKLSLEEFERLEEIYHSPTQHSRRKRRRSGLMPMLHAVLIVLYTSVFIYYHSKTERCESPDSVVKSPASSVIRYHRQVFDSRLKIESPYTGDPSPAIDQAWADLVEDMHVRVSGEYLRSINKTSIPLPDEEDTYWGTLSVNHEVHCLKRLREALYEDHYFPGLTPEEKKMNLMHSAHCVEVLRQAAQCRGDTSIVTMYWGNASPIPVADFDTPHACVDWQAIVDWQLERRFDPKKPGYLRHPTLGLAYPDGKGSKLGVEAS
ncbi:hypothetical protein F5Y17DRAFT_417825 [Xylariaceae sp. FL0594]|nr:hypothetical protein F5Y17DRAFT_417825 [Xylariaceae sp. FL0594]